MYFFGSPEILQKRIDFKKKKTWLVNKNHFRCPTHTHTHTHTERFITTKLTDVVFAVCADSGYKSGLCTFIQIVLPFPPQLDYSQQKRCLWDMTLVYD